MHWGSGLPDAMLLPRSSTPSPAVMPRTRLSLAVLPPRDDPAAPAEMPTSLRIVLLPRSWVVLGPASMRMPAPSKSVNWLPPTSLELLFDASTRRPVEEPPDAWLFVRSLPPEPPAIRNAV